MTGWLSPNGTLYPCRRRNTECYRTAREIVGAENTPEETQNALDTLYAAGWAFVSVTKDLYEAYSKFPMTEDQRIVMSQGAP